MPEFNKAFWKWFGDSKVVDAHGQPLVVYHGTTQDFMAFRPGRPSVGGAIFFGSLEEAQSYAGQVRGARVIPAYLRIERLWDYEDPDSLDALARYLKLSREERDDLDAGTDAYTDAQGLYYGALRGNYDTIESEDFQRFLKKKGYDGFTLNQYGGAKNYAVYGPTQIKSAVGNDGTWDADDPDIRSNPMQTESHDREVAENPSWVDKIVKQHCAPLEAYAQAHGLPMPLLEKCKPAKEFGCGHYGCVMATNDPGIVFKITSDESEAHFIACYMKLRDKLPFDDLKYSGIVDYKAIVGLKESSRSSRRVYAIWREEAQNVGKWENGWKAFLEYKTAEPNERNYFAQQTAAVSALMRTFQANAGQFRLKLKSVKDRADYFDKVRKAIELSADIEVHGTRGELQFTPPSWIKGTRRLAFHLRTCQVAAELLESEYLGDLLGKTLGFFLEKGLLLADVHMGNLGTRGNDKEAIITDPGHLVILKPEWEQVNIEAI